MKLLLLLIVALVVVDVSAIHTTRIHRRKNVRKNLFKYNSRLPGNPEATNPIDKMRNIEDSEYIANITFGTPPQTFSLIMDTGSANVWSSITKCHDKGCSKMHKFNEAASSSFHNLHEPFFLLYGTGYCAGDLANETVGVGDVSITGQAIGCATTVAAFFEQVPDVDGIFGMGLSAIAEPPTLVSPLTNMVNQKEVTAAQFGVYLDSAADENSEITWGAPDKTKYTGELQTVKYRRYLGELLYYMTSWNSMKINGKTVAGGAECDLNDCLAVVDTGTSILVGPTDKINAINKMLDIKQDCSNKDTLPPVVLDIEGRSWSIPSKVYVIEQDKNCTSGFMATPIYQGFWIFGDPFLRTVYTVFNNADLQFHFGESVGPSKI